MFSRIFGTEISFRGQFRLVDCEQLLHEVEIFFNLDESTDLFIRNTRYYESENRTYIGIRARSEGKVQRYIDSLKLLTGFFPYYRKHKLLVCGQFRFVFFKTPSRRVNVSVNFIAPILRDSKLFGDFFPDEMVYPVALTYERKINESLFIGWYGRYYLNLPLDKEQEFDSSLGTGVMLRNQRDFDRINKKTRFEVAFGYNFKHHVEVDAKLGVTLVKKKLFKLGSNLEFSRNKEKSFIDIKLFADDGEHVTLRPFIGYSWIKYHRLQRPSEGKFILGIGLYRWFR